MLKKIVLGGALVLMSGLLVASTAVVPSPGPSSSGAPVIALVNEDEPASFNGSAYNFGSELVSMVANDDRYTWEVVSRSVAEKASADKAVNAVIMLPRSFSHDILTLQDLDPVTAVIDYRVVAGDQLSYERLQNEVFSVLRDFNTRVVKMYFASVAANISGAQVNMDSVVGAQSRLVDALSSSLHPPLAKVGTGQASEIGMAEILRAMNSAWVTAQNSFTETTTSTLDSTSSALDREQPELADYFALQEQIARTNIANGNGGIAAQAESDKRFDDDRFSQHIGSLLSGDGTWSGLTGLSSTDGTGAASGVLATLAGTVAAYDQVAVDYNSRVAGLTAALDGQRTALEGSLHDLERLETRLLQEYFGDDTPVTDANYDDFGPTRLNSGMARTALAEKLADTFSGGGPVATTVGKYEQTVRDLVATIATDPHQYSGLFQTLTAADATFDPTPYIAQLEVIQRYDQAQGSTPPQLSIPDAPSNGRQEVVAASLPVTVEPGESDVVSVALPDMLPAGKVTVSVEPASPCGSLPPGCVQLDQNAKTVTIDNTQGAVPFSITVTYTFDVTGLDGSATVSFSQQSADPGSTAAPRSLGATTYLLAPPAKTAELGPLTSYLSSIQTAGNLLRFLFGSPDDTDTTFRDAVLPMGDFTGRSDESVYNRYGAIGASALEEALSAADVEAYRTLGLDNIAEIVTQISRIRTQLTTIADDTATLSAMHLSEGYFSDVLHQLDAWYSAAMTSVSAASERWGQASNDVIQLSTVPWAGQEPGKAELYLDDHTGPALYATFSQLLDSTSKNARAVATGAQLITDNSAQFDDLVSTVQKAQHDTQAVLDTMTGTIATGSADLATGSDFSKRFATVLSNARAGGADPEAIYEHFANPVVTKDTSAQPHTRGDGGFDYRWVVLFVAGALLGAVVSRLVRRRRGRSAGGMDGVTR